MWSLLASAILNNTSQDVCLCMSTRLMPAAGKKNRCRDYYEWMGYTVQSLICAGLTSEAKKMAKRV